MPDISRRRISTAVCAVAGSACLTFCVVVSSAAASVLPDLLRVDHLSAAAKLPVGMRSALPFLYRVRACDELGYPANHYRTTEASIRALNHLSSASAPRVGRAPLIARGSQTATAASFSPQARLRRFVRTAALAQEMTATAYDSGRSSNGGYGAVNYFGQPLRFGDVAVDPSVIPLGSRLFISGYSDPSLPRGGFYAIANDVGGAIQGKRVDIFLPGPAGRANAFGVEQVAVRVLSRR